MVFTQKSMALKVLLVCSLLCYLGETLRINRNHQVFSMDVHQQILRHTFQLQEDHFAAASMSVNYTREILNLSRKFLPAADIDQRILKVESSYLSREESVKILGNFTFSPLDTDQVNCQNVSVNTIQALLFRTSQMRSYLQNSLSTNQVNFLNDLSARPKVKQSIQNQIEYLKGLEQFLNSGCTKNVKLSDTFFVSNPKANNWILGDWTYDNFIKSYIQVVSRQTKINKCPIQKPFYDAVSEDCINCVYPNNVWNMKLKKCISCPYAQIVNIKTRKCVSQIRYINNIMDQNYPWITDEKILQTVYDQFNRDKALENVVVCPFDTPFIISEQCQACPDKFVYSLERKKCLAIPYNMEYDGNLHKVVQKLYQYQTNEAISSNFIENTRSCPAQYPFYDSITCINCVFPNYFNEKRKKCQPCLNLDLCGAKKLNYVTNSLGSNITGRSTQEVKNYFLQNAQKIKDDSVEQCPIKTPYYNPSTRQCIQCPFDKNLFNISTLNCVACPDKSQFNQTTYLCESPKGVKTFSKAGNLIVENLTKYNDEQTKITGPECSEGVPYFNGKECIKCMNEQLFNVTSKACVYCLANTTYDNVMMKCDSIKYKTNSLTDRLWVDNLVAYQTAYKTNMGKECPTTEPFFNGTACINCQSDQIFNSSSLKCTKCPTGTVFNNMNKNCSESKANIFVPGKTDNLLGVPSYSVDAYTKELASPNASLYTVVKCANDQNSKKTGCVKCNTNYTYFNVRTLECVACKQFNKDQKICYDNMTFLTNTTVSDTMLGSTPGDVDRFIKTQETKLKQTPDLYRSCSKEKPFSIKGVCQTCPQYFNVSSSQCTTCDFFDTASKTCSSKPYISNLKYGVPPYYTKNTTKLLEEYEKARKSGEEVCPFTTPFYNGKECIICPKSDQYFNLDIKKCSNCTAGYQLNTIINECQQQPPKYYTSLESSRLVFDGQPISYYQYKIDQAKKAGSGPCPKDKPYYTVNNQCELCSAPNEYFNLLRRVCTQCPQGTSYVPEDHECQSPIGDIVTPQATLEKSLANLFT